MYQAPAAVWNEIAETQPLATAWAEQMFPLPEAELDRALEREETRLVDEGADGQVASAYLIVMPLLWEREAIRRYKAETQHATGSLPMVETVQQAVMLASRDYPLTKAQQASLAKLLATEPA